MLHPQLCLEGRQLLKIHTVFWTFSQDRGQQEEALEGTERVQGPLAEEKAQPEEASATRGWGWRLGQEASAQDSES